MQLYLHIFSLIEREVLKPRLLILWFVGIGVSWVQLERVNGLKSRSKCGRCLKSASWRAEGPAGDSPKRAAGLNLGNWVESRHVGSFGELGRARRTTRRFTEVPHLAFNFMLNVKFGSVTFDEKPEVAKGTRRLAKSPP
uniref:Uncharacterized protein n=1 Tax=Solanum tuberosum TaxID=4113 RepID=M1DZ93_SOLTU